MDRSKNQIHLNKPQCIIDLTNEVVKIEAYDTILLEDDDRNDDDIKTNILNKTEYSDISSDELQNSKCSSLVGSPRIDHNLSRHHYDDVGGWTNLQKKSEYSYESSVDLQTSKCSAFVESSEEGELPEESPRIGELGDELCYHPEDLMIITKCNKRKRKRSTHKLKKKIRKIKKNVTNHLSEEAEEILIETTTTTLRKRNISTTYTIHTTEKTHQCETELLKEQLFSPGSDTEKNARSIIPNDSENFSETFKLTISNAKTLNPQCVNQSPLRHFKSIDRPLPKCRRNCRRKSSRRKTPQPSNYTNISEASELTIGLGEIDCEEKVPENSLCPYATSDLDSLIARTKQREKKHYSAGSDHVDNGVHTA